MNPLIWLYESTDLAVKYLQYKKSIIYKHRNQCKTAVQQSINYLCDQIWNQIWRISGYSAQQIDLWRSTQCQII